MNKILTIFFKIYSAFIKKTSDYIIFESANDYFDNAYSLYEYIKEHYPQYKRKYLIATKEMKQSGPLRGVTKKEMLNPKNKLALYKYSLKSKFIVFSYTNYWKIFKLPENIRIVNAGHGEFPIKSVEKYYDYLYGKQENKIDIAVVTNEVKEILRKRYPIVEGHNLVVLGTPRTDLMFHPKINRNEFLRSISIEKPEGKHIILSMTTFRNEHVPNLIYFKDEFPIVFDDNQVSELDSLLEKNNQILLIKLHHSQDGVIIPTNYKNIKFINNADLTRLNVEIPELYSIADALITDYSSGFIGYLSLDRKMGFLLADSEQYSNDRGYTINNFKDYLPGDKIYTREAFLDFLNNLASPNDPFKEERHRVKMIFAGDYKDQNCKSYTDYYLENKKNS